MNAQTKPAAARRLFFACGWVMRMLRPEALVTGADLERLQRSCVGESCSGVTDFGE